MRPQTSEQAKPPVPPFKTCNFRWWDRRFRPMPHRFSKNQSCAVEIVARTFYAAASRFFSTCVFNAAPNVDKNVDAARKNARATKPRKLCGIGRFRLSVSNSSRAATVRERYFLIEPRSLPPPIELRRLCAPVGGRSSQAAPAPQDRLAAMLPRAPVSTPPIRAYPAAIMPAPTNIGLRRFPAAAPLLKVKAPPLRAHAGSGNVRMPAAQAAPTCHGVPSPSERISRPPARVPTPHGIVQAPTRRAPSTDRR